MNERGFSLLEVLIAITLTGIIIGVILSSLDIGLSTWKRVQSDSYNLQNQQVVFKYLESDLHNLFYSNHVDKKLFYYGYDGFLFYTINKEEIRQVNYTINYRRGLLIRETYPVTGTDFKIDKQKKEVINFLENTEIKNVRFYFYDHHNKYWRNYWSYREIGYYPSLVKIEIADSTYGIWSGVIEIFTGRQY
ncbi:PulJ/GspJ family protein [Halothermothrix orenii]|uniref:Prepilin-type N-terminal cleavage/methylation domain protein n=1 Tax=Halothermothrix orenii (strain H 168 / OCM 544 / DSM 9562) TaxID=373903 RepID=B8CZ95_HALOH|nr:prepilin-type N-terminal cleavage/methylation domain-containing protein [Halothermothrix orenii]ACL70614.1 prepilin-type N-terminal cleavage/methylation domain protein [Halothermothrix orenii H 168]